MPDQLVGDRQFPKKGLVVVMKRGMTASAFVSSSWLVLMLALCASGCRQEKASSESPTGATAKRAVPAPDTVPEPLGVDLAGQDEEIVIAVEKAGREVRRNPGQADAWGQLGMVLLVHGFHQPAGLCLSTAARLDPAEVRWPYYLYSVVRETNRVAALAHLQTAVENLNPRTMPGAVRRGVRQRLAEALIEDGQPDAALAALVPEPDDRTPDLGHELLRARCHMLRADWTEARPHAEAAAAAEETRRDALQILAQLAQRAGDSADARTKLAEAAGLAPWKRTDPLAAELEAQALGLRADLQNANQLLNAGRFADVRQLLRQTVLRHPGSAYAWLMLGKAEAAAARWERAESCFRKATEHDPELVEAHFQLGQALRSQRRLADAAASFRRGTELKRDSVPTQYMLGLTLMELGLPAEALPAFQICVECRPRSPEGHLGLARAHAALGHVAEAEAGLDYARGLAPFDSATTNLFQEVERELAKAKRP